MTKEQFLTELEECLVEEIPQAELLDTLNYYRDYFREEELRGKTEEEILTSLGSPRLIAHSIQDAHEDAVTGTPEGYYDAEDETFRGEGEVTPSDRMKVLAGNARTFAIVLAVVVVSFFLIRALFPIILFGVIAMWIYNMFRS